MSIAGGALWFVSHLFWWFMAAEAKLVPFLYWWYEVIPHEHSLPVATAFVLGATTPLLLNQLSRVPIFSEDKVQARLVAGRAEPLDVLLRESLKSQSLIALTLRSGKVYVGRVIGLSNPAMNSESVRLSLARSGYRKKDTQELRFTTDYESVKHRLKEEAEDLEEKYNELIDRVLDSIGPDSDGDAQARTDKAFQAVFGKINATYEDVPFSIVIMVREVLSAAPFDLTFFESHFAQELT